MDEIVIRKAEKKDLLDVALIEKSCFSDPWHLDSFEKTLENDFYYFLVATIEDKIVGYIVLFSLYEQAEIVNLAVLESYKKKGIASKLLNEVIRYIKNTIATEIFLDVRESNIVARCFYEKLGFVAYYRQEGFYRNPVEASIKMKFSII